MRYAARTLRRSPGFTVVAVLTLAIGIGANTAIFTLVNSILLRPLAYADPSRLVVVQYEHAQTVAPATFLDWQAASHSFESMGWGEYWTPSLTGGEKADEITALHISPSIMPMMGVKPLLGRAFLPGEDQAGHNRVAMLRYDLWKARFAGDSAVVGRTITLEGEPYTVVGVMPPGFVFARLLPGVSLEQARAELTGIATRLEREYPGTNQHVTVIPLQQKVVGDVQSALLILLVAVGCVLLIACANVAHLQLMRAAAKGREFAVRTALGGSRTRLFQQSLVESLMLSGAGGLLGLALAAAGVRVLVALAPPGLPRVGTVTMDAPVFIFMLIVTVAAATLFGVAPGLAASRVDVQSSLKEGGRGGAEGPNRRRLRAALVVSEFAMALVLLVGAGLVLRSFGALMAVDPGFDASHTISMKVALAGTQHADPVRRLAFFDELIGRVRALPGVSDASAISHVPLRGDDWHFSYFADGHALPRPGEEERAQFLVVRPDYFKTMGIPLRQGRDFTPVDQSTQSHVVIVNERLAKRMWPAETALGKRISVDNAATHPDWFTVVGVAKDVKQGSWQDDDETMYYPSFLGGSYPWEEHPLIFFLNPDYMTLVVRTAGDPSAIVPAITSLVRGMEPDAPVTQVMTMDAAVSQQFTAPRFYLLLLGAFAGVAVLLAAVGVYGVISYSVTRRTHEIGVRLALGASTREAFGLVVRQGMRLAIIGSVVGLAGAVLGTRYLRTLLFGVTPGDPLTFVSVTILLGVIALAATAIPARRASRVDPMTALRSE